jgi:hypothetical protein
MKKTIVSIVWIALLNGVFAWLYSAYSVRFNPTITHSEAYEFGETYGFYFFLLTVVLIVFLAVTNRLPGARKRLPPS